MGRENLETAREALGLRKNERLLDEALLAALRGLSLRSRHAQGTLPGVHRGAQPGRDEEFFQHRGYVRGEDVRAVDWRASARVGHLLVKERHRPRRQPLVLLLDLSASMQFPAAKAKALAAMRLAAALGLLALRRGDPVSLFSLGEKQFAPSGRALPGGGAASLAEALIWGARFGKRGDVLQALARLAPAKLSFAQVVLLSDLYGDEALLEPALLSLKRGGAAMTLLHLLSPEEKSLPAQTHALRDLETGEERPIAAGEAAQFSLRVADWSARLRGSALRAGADWLAIDSSEPAGAALHRWLTSGP